MSTKRRLLIGTALVVALLGGAVAIVPPLLWGDGVDYSSATSIKTSAEYQAPALLEKAWALPVARLYRPGLDYQRNPSFCGPTSVVNVMRSLGQEGSQATVLADTNTRTVFGMLFGGVTLDKLAEIARLRTGKHVTVLRDLDLPAFRALLQRVNDPRVRLIANFTRGPLFASGGGHHSPIAGYLADEDLVLVLDVNKKYQPWLARAAQLLAAINTFDRGNKQMRGLLLIE